MPIPAVDELSKNGGEDVEGEVLGVEGKPSHLKGEGSTLRDPYCRSHWVGFI